MAPLLSPAFRFQVAIDHLLDRQCIRPSADDALAAVTLHTRMLHGASLLGSRCNLGSHAAKPTGYHQQRNLKHSAERQADHKP